MSGRNSVSEQSIVSLISLNLKSPQARKFWLLQTGVVFYFIFWATFFVYLRLPWTREMAPRPKSLPSSMAQRHESYEALDASGSLVKFVFPTTSNELLSIDIWFALGSVAAIDAFAIVASFNRFLINNWHYFVSLRMMSVASLISFIVYLFDYTTMMAYVSSYPILAYLLPCGAHLILGYILNRLRRPPPISPVNSYFGSLQGYSDVMCRSSCGWQPAIVATSATGCVADLVTATMPTKCATIAPLIEIGFETVFLAFKRIGRTPEYTLIGGTLIQAMTFAHWGFPQVAMAPCIALPSWAFLSLLIIGRLILDLHLITVFRKCPEFHWARKQVLTSTQKLVQICIGMLFLEWLGCPIVSYFKVLVVPTWYLTSTLGVALPASYSLALQKS